MNLSWKNMKTHALLLLVTVCFVAALTLLYLRAEESAGGADYTISTQRGPSVLEEVVLPEKIDINTADAEQLMTLPGIGEVMAKRIIRYREENGPFVSVEDLLNISGIGENTLESLRGHITLSR